MPASRSASASGSEPGRAARPGPGAASAPSFGLVEFQLVLLRRMADFQPELVEDARRALGATTTRMREANAHWQRMTRSSSYRGGLGPLRGALGAPLVERERPLGAVTCHIVQWRLPVWPALRFEAVAAPGAGGTLVSTVLVRDPQSPAPAPRTLADLKPWSCVIDDVQRAFPSARHLEGTAPSRWTLEFDVPADADATGTGTGVAGPGGGADLGSGKAKVRAEFVWGLLQHAEQLR